ncbi:DUF4411 family protein [Acidipropionibacterium acidipropionici]|uniref:DUF4411 family protein n=1 Tax=Acidipropionibacterium acidipropionici TaxID=1748 RepID=UPI00110C122F|nr:DUF4411 family protein [Acidipropionibacterium acidipropionici]QCV93952.1 DUF4411 family protein [Acidipropionibacterium acidipropionici]
MYLIDSNVLIEAKNRYYAFDIAPGFWAWLEQAHQQSVACSIEAVRNELLDGNDELAVWAQAHTAFFRPIDQATTQHFGSLTGWSVSRHFTPAALAAFTGNDADYLLVAYARAHHHTVVTHEIASPNARTRVKIPDACSAMGVSTVDTFQMLRRTGACLDLR